MNDNQSISQYIGTFNRLFEGPEVDERLKKLVIRSYSLKYSFNFSAINTKTIDPSSDNITWNHRGRGVYQCFIFMIQHTNK